MKLGVSLVIYKEPETRLIRFIENVRKAFSEHELVIVIHENSPHDIKYPESLIITRFKSNIGYGGGHNSNYSLLKIRNCDRILVSNTDVTFKSSVRSLLLDGSKVIIAPIVLNNDGSNQGVIRAFPNIVHKTYSFIFGYPYSYEIQSNNLLTVPSISGCYFVLNPNKYVNLGYDYLFDPDFFMYEEDTDLCRRLWSIKGVGLNPEVKIYHDYGKGSSASIKLFLYHLRSIIIYFRKWGFFDKASQESHVFMKGQL
ncbi:hypothetical protein N8450_01350 [Schleiferiaceae bacterium]|nr:hypothetical protein [Schleiferiaceae bacterium]